MATPVVALDVAAQAALRVSPTSGRAFDGGHETREDRVALVGELAAVGLGIGLGAVDGRSSITVGSHDYIVLGVVRSVDPTVALSVILPSWVTKPGASDLSFQEPTVVLHTQSGAARQVGSEAPLALNPRSPEDVVATVPPDPRELRRGVESDTRNLFLALALVSLLVGALGVSNTMLVAVLERRHELGVRRALGATTGSMIAQIMIESGMLGAVGGVAGTTVGVDVTFGAALAQGWTAVLPPWLYLAGPALGLVMGLLAGMYPAVRAARIEPVAALA